jgi:hypothetical protein
MEESCAISQITEEDSSKDPYPSWVGGTCNLCLVCLSFTGLTRFSVFFFHVGHLPPQPPLLSPALPVAKTMLPPPHSPASPPLVPRRPLLTYSKLPSMNAPKILNHNSTLDVAITVGSNPPPVPP